MRAAATLGKKRVSMPEENAVHQEPILGTPFPVSEEPKKQDRGASCRTGCKTRDHDSYAHCLKDAGLQIGNLK